MWILKDNKDRIVVVREDKQNGQTPNLSFWAKQGDDLEEVAEATVCTGGAGNDTFLEHAYIRKVLDAAGFNYVGFTINVSKYDPIDMGLRVEWEGHGYGSWNPTRPRQLMYVGNKAVNEPTFKSLSDIRTELGRYNYLINGTMSSGKMYLPVQNALEMIGAGNIVTPNSLKNGYAKGESRPRLAIGDNVEITEKKGKDVGTIVKMAAKATVMRKDGKKSSIMYSSLKRTASAGFDKTIVDSIDPSLRENLKHVLAQKHRLYRAKTEKKDLCSPMFPEPNEHQVKLENAQSCVCPLCGWQMAEFKTWNSEGMFTCCFCKAEGQIIQRTEDEVTLLMNRQPAKNRFAIKEVRCCSNCGIFRFETGRQGKRSTGYCKTTNQCVQGFNTCDYWFPSDPDRYSSEMRQHITNLGYGVADTRNTERNDIRDTVYREEDHIKEKERAEQAKMAYTQAYNKFMNELVKLATSAKLHEGTLDEKEVEEWKKVLDDGC